MTTYNEHRSALIAEISGRADVTHAAIEAMLSAIEEMGCTIIEGSALKEMQVTAERALHDRNQTANAANRQAHAHQASTDQILADIRTIRARHAAAGWCSDCAPIAKAAFEDLGPLLPDGPPPLDFVHALVQPRQEGKAAALAVIEDLRRQLKERDEIIAAWNAQDSKFRQHSITLNTISWKIACALDPFPPDATEVSYPNRNPHEDAIELIARYTDLHRQLAEAIQRAERAERVARHAGVFRKAVAQWDTVRDVNTPVGALIAAVDAYEGAASNA